MMSISPQIPHDALELPKELEDKSLRNVKNWLGFSIWGFMLHHNQSPWFSLIECMHIIFDQKSKSGRVFDGLRSSADGRLEHEWLGYSVPQNRNLRHLLFRDDEVSALRQSHSTDMNLCWAILTQKTADGTGGSASRFPIDLGYLEHAFKDFRMFANAVDLLRSTEIDGFTVQRWTSRHLLPLGPNMLFADVDENYLADRLIFRRNGELLFMMLNRSSEKSRLRVETLLNQRLLDVRHPLDVLAAKMARPATGGSTAGVSTQTSTGYLPMPEMQAYEHLAEDWISLLDLGDLRMESLFDPLMRLSGLHQIIYILSRCASEQGLDRFPPLVLDFAASARNNPIQKLAADYYDNHRKMPLTAAESYLDKFTETDEWKSILGRHSDKLDAYKLIKQRFLYPNAKSEPLQSSLEPPRAQLDAVLENFQKPGHTIWATLSTYARKIGLVVARPRAGTWYSPSDSLLEAIVFANVREPTELKQFLRVLFRRYQIVIGPEQACIAFRDISLEPFEANVGHLEERLSALGYIDRKSDACAFIVNPFFNAQASILGGDR